MRIVVSVLLLCWQFTLFAQTIQVSLFNSKNVTTYTLSVRQGNYLLSCEDEKLAEYKRNSIFFINLVGDKIELRDQYAQIGVFKKIRLSSQDAEGVMLLRGVSPATDAREYNDDLIFEISGNQLKVVNHINLEKYIAAVIEAESGINAGLEYYKAQGVLVRTYTIKNIYKHAEEGFNLCDEVHCQAYHGRSARNPDIYRATSLTEGQVLIDSDSVLAMTPFHSSCGGQTSAAGIYWQSDLPYLQSVQDPFCQNHRNASWQKQIPLSEWQSFLKSKGIDKTAAYSTYNFTNRQKYFSQNPDITMRQIRDQFKLRSTYFSLVTVGETVTFNGRGFGHGIGMCQIGAMEMAQVGYTYLDIIHFYFRQVSLTNYREMELSRY